MGVILFKQCAELIIGTGVFMSLCILGQEKTESNLRLLEEAKKTFGSVFFVPVKGIGVGLNSEFSITYRTSNLLKFDAVLPRVPRKYYSYAYQLLSLFPSETFMPVPPIAFLLASERFFLLTVLRKRGVDTLHLHLARSVKASERILDSVDFPIVIRVPTQKTGVTVKSSSEAKSIIEAFGSLEHPVLIEERVRDVVSAYVARPEVIAAVKKSTKDQDVIFAPGTFKSHKLTVEAKQLALKAAAAIDTQIVRVDMSLKGDPKVVNIELNPELVGPSKATRTNIPKEIIERMHDNYKLHAEKPMLMKFFEDAKSVVKDVLKNKQ
jgi:glutathione synthase/RimK-type ligase-like ATP-grasp enzyme